MRKFVLLATAAVISVSMCYMLSCSHAPYTCSKGMSSDTATMCCSIYCRDKKMEPQGFLDKYGEDHYRCVCRQPYYDSTNHKGKGPSGLF